MKSLLNRKGQAGTLQSIIITILIVGIVLGIGFLLLEEFQDMAGDTTTAVANESVTLADYPTGAFVAYNSTTASVYCYNSFAVTSVINTSGEVTITSGNYSFDPDTGKVWNLTSEFPLNMFNVSYSYKHSSSQACAGLDDTVEATQTIPAWLTIIIILVIVGILLAIVFKVMPSSPENAGGRRSSGWFSGFKGSSSTTAEI